MGKNAANKNMQKCIKQQKEITSRKLKFTNLQQQK